MCFSRSTAYNTFQFEKLFWIWWKGLDTIIVLQDPGSCCKQTHAAFEVGLSLDQGQGVYSHRSEVDDSSQVPLCHKCIIVVMTFCEMSTILYMMCNVFFMIMSWHANAFCITSPLGEPLVTNGFTSQRASKAELYHSLSGALPFSLLFITNDSHLFQVSALFRYLVVIQGNVIKSLALGRYSFNFRWVIFKLIARIDVMSIFCEIYPEVNATGCLW